MSLPEGDGLGGGCLSRGQTVAVGGTGRGPRTEGGKHTLTWSFVAEELHLPHDSPDLRPRRRAQSRGAGLTSETKTRFQSLETENTLRFRGIGEGLAQAQRLGQVLRKSDSSGVLFMGLRAPPFPLSPVGGSPMPGP